MRKVWAWGGAAAIAAIAACATSTAPGSGENDSDSGDIPLYDAGNTQNGDGGSSTSCTLGTPDHCGTCATVCPGPTDADGGTERICSDSTTTGTCDIICKGEWYDLNGNVADGCEAQDPIVHDSADAAVPETATTGGLTVPDPYWYIYGDARQHDVAPTSRALGREDWYVVTAPDNTPSACLTIDGFPSDDQFEVCLTNKNNESIEVAQCKTVTLAISTGCASNSTPCCVSTTGGSGGPYYVRVRKLDGSNTPNGYALFIKD